MKKKVLFVMHMPPPVHGAAMMGKYIHDSNLINEKFECHYINLATAKNLDDIGKIGLKKLMTFTRLLRNIRKEIKLFKPDLVYITPNSCGAPFYKDFVVAELVKSMRCKVLLHYHNKGVVRYQNKWLDNILYKKFFKNTKVILLAKKLYQDIKKYINPENTYFCANGIPIIKDLTRNKIQYSSNSHAESFKFLYLSNMIISKGVYTLLYACKILKEHGVTFNCEFVGGWKDIHEENFNNMVEEYKLQDCARYLKPKYDKDKRNVISKSDCLVFPSYEECFPLVLLEAMQQGLPCISTYEGGIPNIIDEGLTGLLTPAHNAEILADKMQWMIEHSDEAKAMGVRGKEKFEKEYTIEVFEKRMCEIIKDVIKEQCLV